MRGMRLVTECRYEEPVHVCSLSSHLDAGVAEDLQGGPHIGLELVLHPGQTQQLHLHLQALDHGGHLQGAVVDAQLGLDVASLERREGTGVL